MEKHAFYLTYPIKTLKEMVYTSVEKNKERVAFQEKQDKNWKDFSYIEFLEQTENLAVGLFDLGIKKGDKIAIISKNRVDWAAAYMACAISGIIAIPIDKEMKEQEIYHTLHLSEAKAILCSEEYVDIVFYLKSKLGKLKYLISFDETTKKVDYFIKSLYEKGKTLKEKGKKDALNQSISENDIVSMLFTSGTTGSSKIVPLTHKNLVTNIIDTCCYVFFDERDKWLSVLPMHHVYECTCGFLIPLYKGASIAFAESLYKIADNAKEVKPTLMLGVPALYDSMYKKILSGIKAKPLGGFKLKLGLSICKIAKLLAGKNIGRKIFHELHDKMGGNLRLLITGGAAANPEISIAFHKLGFTFLQGAGMTEASPIYALNPDWYFKHESIGIPLPNCELQILDPDHKGIGEIAIKGGNIFSGYHNAKDINEEAFIGDWFRTGDLGYVDSEGYYYITGRMKNIIVTSLGKNICPEEVETWLSKSPFILEALVWGGDNVTKEGEGVNAIIVPDFESLDIHCRNNNIEKTEQEIKKIISKEIKHYCSHLAHYKRVKKFIIRNEELPKTTTKKIKRYLVLSELMNSNEIK